MGRGGDVGYCNYQHSDWILLFRLFLPRMKLFPGIPSPISKKSPRHSTLFAALVVPLFLVLLETSLAHSQPLQNGEDSSAATTDSDDAAATAYWKRAGFVGMREGVRNVLQIGT